MPRYQDVDYEVEQAAKTQSDTLDTSSVPDLPIEPNFDEKEDMLGDSDTKDLVSSLKICWENAEELTRLQLDIVNSCVEASEDLGVAVAQLSYSFIGEKEGNYGMTVTEAEHRAKQAFGGRIEKLRGKIEGLKLLHQTVIQRVDMLIGNKKLNRF